MSGWAYEKKIYIFNDLFNSRHCIDCNNANKIWCTHVIYPFFDAVIIKYMNPQRYSYILKMIRILCVELIYIICIIVTANILDIDIRNIKSFKVFIILSLPCIIGAIICSKTLIKILIKPDNINYSKRNK